MFNPASRMEALPFSEIRVMMEKATQMQKNGEDVIHMEIGRPDFDTPEVIKQAANRALANGNHYPAIDVSASISRLMVEIVDPEHRKLASRIRDIMSVYEKNADLVAIGAYKPGTNRNLDYALSKIDAVNEFLTQDVDEMFSYDQCIAKMRAILR